MGRRRVSQNAGVLVDFTYPFFAEPNDESAANVDAAKTWRDDRKKFEEIAGNTVRKSLGI